MGLEIWHNPRCSKSRQTLQLLRDRGIEPDVVLYLEQTPPEEDIRAIVNELDVKARDIMRTNEAVYRENDLKNEKDEDELFRAMVEHPILIERPIVRGPKGTAIGRPPENVLKVL